MAEPLLQVKSLEKTYGNLQVLQEITFDLHRGEILGLVGRRGAGKTTLLSILGGSQEPTCGSIRFQGQEIELSSPNLARQKGIELVHQQPQLVPQQGILENIFLGREINRYSYLGMPDFEQMYASTQAFLADFDVPVSILNESVPDLNDEQRQIVALARAFCQPVELLLLDEMLSHLNFQRQEQLLDYVRRAAQQGTGTIICSEDLKHLFNVTDRILVLYEGRLIADRRTDHCTPRDIVELVVGVSDREQVTPVIWALENYHKAQRQTEELFQTQVVLHENLEARDALNRQLIEKLSDQVVSMDRLNAALQKTQLRLLTEREEERKALARELHDSVIQDLLTMNYRLEEAEIDESSNEQRQELRAIRHAIRQVISDLRQVCRDLRPPTIDNHGLPAAIRSFVQEWRERSGIHVQVEIDDALGRLPESIELSVFRIIQEGLNNVSKHSDAQQAQIVLRRTPVDNLLIRISDDGQGFIDKPNLADLSRQQHFGLVGISERAALLGGSMQFETPRSGGLVLQVEIPSPYPSA